MIFASLVIRCCSFAPIVLGSGDLDLFLMYTRTIVNVGYQCTIIILLSAHDLIQLFSIHLQSSYIFPNCIYNLTYVFQYIFDICLSHRFGLEFSISIPVFVLPIFCYSFASYLFIISDLILVLGIVARLNSFLHLLFVTNFNISGVGLCTLCNLIPALHSFFTALLSARLFSSLLVARSTGLFITMRMIHLIPTCLYSSDCCGDCDRWEWVGEWEFFY